MFGFTSFACSSSCLNCKQYKINSIALKLAHEIMYERKFETHLKFLGKFSNGLANIIVDWNIIKFPFFGI